MTKELLIQKLTSRKFLMAVGAAMLIVLTQGLDISVDETLYNQLLSIVVAYIVGEGAVDVARILKG